ncbi:hypothetical protein P280DRAFT_462718 [Massarina eburnea CBS 473.64]|uniref:Restriction of telomere capping protein 4 n=1 Tax=Massarina eburnea CBS 473.64 TaxID=1395130 RepID=A0A6A6RHL7_9PLEO|nr:hypothetical protein P280DRAFT_462718 [Massarina eburnea CBS 473.64]
MPPLARNGSRLLSQVGGKAHASSADHEEDIRARYPPADKMTTEQIHGDPISSSDDEQKDVNAEQRSSRPLPSLRASQSPPNSSTKRRQTGNAAKGTGVSGAKRKRGHPKQKIQVPRGGTYEKGQKSKRGRQEEEKENTAAMTSNSSEQEPVNRPFIFGMEHSGPAAPNRQKQTYRPSRIAPKGVSNDTKAMKNIHAKSNKGPSKQYGKTKTKLPPQEDDHNSDTSSKSPESELEVLLSDANKKREDKSPQRPSPAKAPRSDLALLGTYKQPESSPPIVEDDSSDLSSVPASSQALPRDRDRDQDTLANLEEHIANLPSEDDTEFLCPLCQEPVDQDHFDKFWNLRHKPRTVRNQSIFCKEHNQRTAETRYKKEGYPRIDWETLPDRIRNLRPQIVKILRNETESKYRNQHASKLLSGKAAVLPTRGKGQKRAKVEEQIEGFEDMPASTGYYGPRGRRLMMETMTTNLSDVIREVSADDPVIGRSGFAVYLQTVLVPEVTVLLVREDFNVSVQMAEELIEQSKGLGSLLHEEVDDRVEPGSDEEEEREMVDLDDDEKYEAVVKKLTKEKRRKTKGKEKKGEVIEL